MIPKRLKIFASAKLCCAVGRSSIATAESPPFVGPVNHIDVDENWDLRVGGPVDGISSWVWIYSAALAQSRGSRDSLIAKRKSNASQCENTINRIEALEGRRFLDGGSEAALQLDGDDDFARVTGSPSLIVGASTNQDFTIEAWFFVPAGGPARTDAIVSSGGPTPPPSTTGGYMLDTVIDPTGIDKLEFKVVLSGCPITFSCVFNLSASLELTAGWHHAAGVYDGEFTPGFHQRSLFYDGARVGTTTSSNAMKPTPGSLVVGGGFNVGINDNFTGWIDEVRQSDNVRYPDATYSPPHTPFNFDDHTVGLWHFDEPIGSTSFADVSNNGNTLLGFNGAQIGMPPVVPLVVDTLSDSGASTNTLSLRRAIVIANASWGRDTINFAPGLAGTITLDAGELSITDHMTINGPDATRLAISGNSSARVFKISGIPTEVVISGLTIEEGRSPLGDDGGGIRNIGNLILIDSTVSGNSGANGGGIYNRGNLTVANSTISGNVSGSDSGGGGIMNQNGTVFIANCTISQNDGIFGGGIGNDGVMHIVNSTISGNLGEYGGGIFNFSDGNLRVTNSTITNNRVDTNGDLYGLGGGIYSESTGFVINNTIVAGNFYGSGTTLSDVGFDPGGTATGSHNLIGTGGSGGLSNGVNGNIVGVPVADLLLGPLSDNGGPTKTHHLLPSSPAINAGDNTFIPSGVTTDQRGFPRIVGTHVDIGASEFVIPGDLNFDGTVSIADFITLASNFNKSPATYEDGDVNYDGSVTIADFIDLAANFNASLPAPAPAITPQAPAADSVSLTSPTTELLQQNDGETKKHRSPSPDWRKPHRFHHRRRPILQRHR
jgi:hypothetical protein